MKKCRSLCKNYAYHYIAEPRPIVRCVRRVIDDAKHGGHRQANGAQSVYEENLLKKFYVINIIC